MRESTLYSIVTSQDGHAARLGWVSSATGITYCGICLAAPLTPRVGELCDHCGACVVSVFDAADGPEAIRHAWRQTGARAEVPALASVAC
jgi:hypothetical protein